jgi:excisionase family DNA binding protein
MNDYRSLTIAETAELLSCSEPTVYALLKQGELESYLLTRGCRRVIASSLESFITRQRKREAAGVITPKGTPTTRTAVAV